MGIQKQHEDFDLWWEGNAIAMMCEEDEALKIWQLAQAQAVSDDEIIAELSQKLADCQDGNNQLQAESDKYFNELNEAQNAGIKALESYGVVQKKLNCANSLADVRGKFLDQCNKEPWKYQDKYAYHSKLNFILILLSA